ncbi:hypothetical protein OsI_34577 [Oryza sativa Indica Group]|uniref:Uncharacterized protein n=1 Tax=Oryza sativa subsp. indica TaxID=39946 RepID=B8BI56_ORYSI|nr:hypothetical protein OsI_34577 [Oryza sativa Indica Group]
MKPRLHARVHVPQHHPSLPAVRDQWGIDLSKVAVLVGEKGDIDRERLLPGLHRTVILPGMVAAGSEELLCDEDGFTTEDVVAIESPNIVTLADGQDIAAAADLLKVI